MSDGARRSAGVAAESPVQPGKGVGSYTGYREVLDAAVLHREMPSSDVVMLIGLGEPVTVVRSPRGRAGGTSRSVVSALRSAVAVTSHRGVQHGIAIRLDPLQAYRLFGLPMHEISDDMVDPSALLGGSGALLTEQLAETPGWRARFDLLDHALSTRIARGPAPDPAVIWAWRAMQIRPLTVSVADLAKQIGWSRRHFERRFRHQIGLPPGTVTRILRFERALAALADNRGTLADVAAHAGYSDHAHLARDVRSRTGSSPTGLARHCREQH